MKEVLQKIINNSRWTYPAFDGKIIIEGRILSPSESGLCGLSSALIAKSILSEQHIKELSTIQEDQKFKNDEDINQVFQILKNFNPDKLIEMQESQDKIIVTCVMRASIDEGITWQAFKLVLQESQQSVKRNCLWIGMLEDKDRKAMIELCLEGHKKASETIRRTL